jgi:hypothetical protein
MVERKEKQIERAIVLLAVVLLLAIAFLLLKSSYSLRGLEQNPAAVGGGKK